MSRPKPQVLLSYVDKKTYQNQEVLAASGIYAVFYNGAPVNLRKMHSLISSPSPKYQKSSFGNYGHAFNLAEKLNKLFKTDKFEVYELTGGKPIIEDEIKKIKEDK
jgi:hypothetical protein